MNNEKMQTVCSQINHKSNLKISIYQNAESAFEKLEMLSERFPDYFHSLFPDSAVIVKFERNHSQSFSLRFGSDILFFMLHSNVFDFSRDHDIRKTSYIRENKDRAYCGLINIYNFLTDSLVYNRCNDIGYLIGRIFINLDNHYYMDGKKELGQIYNNFASAEFTEDLAQEVLLSAIQYTSNFDLLVPPYELVKEITIQDMLEIKEKRIPIQTAKRLGFRFQADKE
jgi:hypothetical protein